MYQSIMYLSIYHHLLSIYHLSSFLYLSSISITLVSVTCSDSLSPVLFWDLCHPPPHHLSLFAPLSGLSPLGLLSALSIFIFLYPFFFLLFFVPPSQCLSVYLSDFLCCPSILCVCSHAHIHFWVYLHRNFLCTLTHIDSAFSLMATLCGL